MSFDLDPKRFAAEPVGAESLRLHRARFANLGGA